MKLTILLALIPAAALANNSPPPSTPTPAPVAVSGSVAAAVAGSRSEASAGADASSTANGGNSTVESSVAAENTAEGGSGGNGGNVTYRGASAPAVAQGSIGIVGCGAGGNAGGSNSHGAAFLGLSFVTPECHGWSLANAYLAIGERQAACEVLNTQKAAKRAKKRGAKLPDCNNLPVVVVPDVPRETEPVVVNVAAPDLSLYATKAELAESQRRQDSAMQEGGK